jgi:hypothetical protein
LLLLPVLQGLNLGWRWVFAWALVGPLIFAAADLYISRNDHWVVRRMPFGDLITSDGYRISKHGIFGLRLKKGAKQYFVFVEPNFATPRSYQIDTSGVWLDEKFQNRLADRDLEQVLLGYAVEYCRTKRIPVEV